MKSITLSKMDRSLHGVIPLPASKSISNRLLIIQELCGKPFGISNLSEADDTLLLSGLLREMEHAKPGKQVLSLDTANAGTVMRFLTALLSSRPGRWMLTGSDRMKQRPVGGLVDALISLGAVIDYLGKPGYPPLLVKGTTLKGGTVAIDAGVSSQFISALLMIAPGIPGGLTIKLKGDVVSSPYLKMTIDLMEHFGIRIKSQQNQIRVHPGAYQPKPFTVPADWSAAAFWYEAVAFSARGDLELPGLVPGALQGDAVLAEIYRNFGVHTEFSASGARLTREPVKIDGFYFDFTDYPDIAQAVIATRVGLGIRGRFEGLKSLQIKETDRLRAIKSEIEKLGFECNITARGEALAAMEISPSRHKTIAQPVFETFGDHRMAMSLAPFAMQLGSVRIQNPDVVVKSYPRFWEHLKMTGFQII
ncbi:MAG TPA: 3-phosphoshikimate 1-carboxyvinyltransferase [Bacteroidales bacterium]|nr:3-phosphoshikimate 1-carboxyvinyltransferase [Bacteroidales bacterium]